MSVCVGFLQYGAVPLGYLFPYRHGVTTHKFSLLNREHPHTLSNNALVMYTYVRTLSVNVTSLSFLTRAHRRHTKT